MFKKCDVQIMKCFRYVTFKKYGMFQKRDVQKMKCFKNGTFLKHCLDT